MISLNCHVAPDASWIVQQLFNNYNNSNNNFKDKTCFFLKIKNLDIAKQECENQGQKTNKTTNKSKRMYKLKSFF